MKKLFVLTIAFLCHLCVFAQGVYIFRNNQVTTISGNAMEAIYRTEDNNNLMLWQRDSICYGLARTNVDSMAFYYERDVTISKDGYGPFSVGANDTIYFAPANLQYKPSTQQWRFAKHQWDYVGDDQEGTVYDYGVKCNNNKISGKYDGWIDLFCWGTGNNPVLRSELAKDYQQFYDWGDNKIEDYPEKTWRTITYNELYYILYQRQNASQLVTFGYVDSIGGMILFPDDWDIEQFPVKTIENSWYEASQTNKYNEEQWKKMEELGAVFLVGAGYRGARNGRIRNGINTNEMYWLSDEENQQLNKLFCFISLNEVDLGIDSTGRKVFRIYGYLTGAAVRLVRRK